MKKYRIVSGFILIVFIFISLITASAAWFASFITAHTEGEFTGSSIASYFADGDGTEGDPYIISNAKHLYNLAWLQNKNALGENKTYFKVCEIVGTGDNVQHVPTTIDMAGAISGVDEEGRSGAIPPIGTDEYPFLGYFDGFGSTISNLWVSTVKEDWKEQPEGVGDYTSKYVGLFGAIGGDAIIEDFVLDRIEVKSHIDNATVGILCGYVDAMIYNVGVYNGIVTLAAGVTSRSEYTLVGEISDGITWTDMPEIDAAYGDGSGGSSGNDDGAGWGGSLDMYEITLRLSSIFNKLNKKTSGARYAIDSSGFKVSLYTYGAFSETTINTMYLRGDSTNGYTYLPLNVDYSGYTTENGINYSGYYADNTSETPHRLNSGYLVGAGSNGATMDSTSMDTSNPIVRHRILRYGYIYNSINGSSSYTSDNSITYTSNKQIDILTWTPTDSYVLISDDGNKNSTLNDNIKSYSKKSVSDLKLKRYDAVISSYRQTLSKNTNLHGIHFMPQIPAPTSGNTILAANLDLVPANVKLGKKSVSNLVAGTIDFNVETMGYITVIAGSTYSTSSQSLFDLYKVSRDSSGSVTSLEKINVIYTDGNGNYAYNTPTSSINQIAFDMSHTATLPVRNMLYYFEIPVNGGEYVISAAKNSNAGSYLYYLDIGANGDEVQGGDEGESGEIVDGVYAPVMFDVDYVVSPSTDVSDENYENHKTLLRIAKASTVDDIMLYFLAAGELNQSKVYYCQPTGAEITDIAKDPQSEVVAKDATFAATSFKERKERLEE